MHVDMDMDMDICHVRVCVRHALVHVHVQVLVYIYVLKIVHWNKHAKNIRRNGHNMDAKMDKDMDAGIDMDMDADMGRVMQVYFKFQNDISSGNQLNIFLCQMSAEKKFREISILSES